MPIGLKSGKRINKKEDKGFKFNASDLLNLYVIVRHFLEKHVPVGPDIASHVESYCLACRSVDILSLIHI